MLRRGKKPVPHGKIEIAQYGDQTEFERWRIVKEQQIVADENRHHSVDHVVPGENDLGSLDTQTIMPNRHYRVDLPAGKTTTVSIGGDGQTLTGNLPEATSYSYASGYLQAEQPVMPEMANWKNLTPAQQEKAQQDFHASDAYQFWQRNSNIAQFQVQKDGSFSVEDIPAGKYQLSVQVGDSDGYLQSS